MAVLEFKSQVGSFGNNFNNRSEEAIGNAADLWVAHRNGAYMPSRHKHAGELKGGDDPRPPFLGYLMILEDCKKSTSPVKADSAHYEIFPEFEGASYAERYRLLCDKLMEQNLYGAASLLLSGRAKGKSKGEWRSMSNATDPTNLFRELAARLLAASQEP